MIWFSATAQPKYEMVTNVVNPVTITIPKGSLLGNAKDISYKGTNTMSLKVILYFPLSYGMRHNDSFSVSINNFPYTPKLFDLYTWPDNYYNSIHTVPGFTCALSEYMLLKSTLTLQVYPYYRPTTNYDAMGVAHIKPVFNSTFSYTPITNVIQRVSINNHLIYESPVNSNSNPH